MTAISYVHGHAVRWVVAEGIWRYADTGEQVDVARARPCPRCGRLPTPEGYDACLGYIPGVTAACCGHGVHEPFIMRSSMKEGDK